MMKKMSISIANPFCLFYNTLKTTPCPFWRDYGKIS